MGLKRLGLFGGAFDPPHNAHAALARCAMTQLRLDGLRIFPTGQAWHKTQPLSPAADRLAMARLAFESLPGAVVDAREMQREGATYTLDTLRELRAEWPQAQLLLVIGTDQAAFLPNWRGWTEIVTMATLCVAHRPGGGGVDDLRRLPGWPPRAVFETLTLSPMEVSSTAIRSRVAAGQSIDHLVAPAVARYIDQHHLYIHT